MEPPEIPVESMGNVIYNIETSVHQVLLASGKLTANKNRYCEAMIVLPLRNLVGLLEEQKARIIAWGDKSEAMQTAIRRLAEWKGTYPEHTDDELVAQLDLLLRQHPGVNKAYAESFLMLGSCLCPIGQALASLTALLMKILMPVAAPSYELSPTRPGPYGALSPPVTLPKGTETWKVALAHRFSIDRLSCGDAERVAFRRAVLGLTRCEDAVRACMAVAEDEGKRAAPMVEICNGWRLVISEWHKKKSEKYAAPDRSSGFFAR
ncbi:MAG: hypothetical protein M1832_001182 [Thelocarpon impressellum]|nr:MAG: hypothetical protein M1832_001182 [Thelocarpon impressellum]